MKSDFLEVKTFDNSAHISELFKPKCAQMMELQLFDHPSPGLDISFELPVIIFISWCLLDDFDLLSHLRLTHNSPSRIPSLFNPDWPSGVFSSQQSLRHQEPLAHHNEPMNLGIFLHSHSILIDELPPVTKCP